MRRPSGRIARAIAAAAGTTRCWTRSTRPRRRGSRPILVGDPGCLATIAERLDAKYAIGSAIGVAHGLALGGVSDRVVALFGDSAFFHSAMPALCHAVAARSPILMIVLDNQSTLTSGNQPHPGVGRDALGRPSPEAEHRTHRPGLRSR